MVEAVFCLSARSRMSYPSLTNELLQSLSNLQLQQDTLIYLWR